MRGHLAFQGVRGESQALRHVSYMAQSLISAMSAIRPLYANSRRDAAMPRAVEKCQEENSGPSAGLLSRPRHNGSWLTMCIGADERNTYTVAGFTGVRWISRMSPWCTVASSPLSQAIVTASQLISATLPPSAASPRQ